MSPRSVSSMGGMPDFAKDKDKKKPEKKGTLTGGERSEEEQEGKKRRLARVANKDS